MSIVRSVKTRAAFFHILPLFIVSIAWIWLAITLLKTAWMGDDAFITWRVIDNFINGYGLRWNIDERVQPYTHPLWMLLHIPFYAVWRNIYLLSLSLSFILSLASVWLLVRTFALPYINATFLISLLIFSNGWINYAVSGLENPLSYLLVAAFGWVLIHNQSSRRILWLSLCLALAMMNRFDLGIALLPPYLLTLWPHRKKLPLAHIALGFSPMIAWHSFSLFYYGFIFPNTKYAKLNTGIDSSALFNQGLNYFYDMANFDKTSLLILLGGIIALIWRLDPRHTYPPSAPPKGAVSAFAAGMFGYCGYVVCVGGDFMSGRFWSVPVFMAVWLIASTLQKRLPFGLIAIILFVTAVADHASDRKSRNERNNPACVNCFPAGVADERWYYQGNHLFIDFPRGLRSEPGHMWVNVGKTDAQFFGNQSLLIGNVGMRGFYSGPNVKFVDLYALTDPLLARLPVEDPRNWRIGHFNRRLPKGYLLLSRGKAVFRMHPALFEYYKPLRVITSDPLWSWERILTIVRFNLGSYDRWRDQYVKEAYYTPNY